jgi:protoporphyrinogen oxidase
LTDSQWRAKWAARRDYYFPKHLKVGSDASIGEIVRAKLGRELSYQFIEPMIGGIQAGRIDELSASRSSPLCWRRPEGRLSDEGTAAERSGESRAGEQSGRRRDRFFTHSPAEWVPCLRN